jgi:hypothetical protein
MQTTSHNTPPYNSKYATNHTKNNADNRQTTKKKNIMKPHIPRPKNSNAESIPTTAHRHMPIHNNVLPIQETKERAKGRDKDKAPLTRTTMTTDAPLARVTQQPKTQVLFS